MVKEAAPNSQGVLEQSMLEEAFCIYLNPATNVIHITERGQVQDTFEVFVEVETAKAIAGRRVTCLTAFLEGKPLWADGNAPIRDINAIDDILELYHGLMLG